MYKCTNIEMHATVIRFIKEAQNSRNKFLPRFNWRVQDLIEEEDTRKRNVVGVNLWIISWEHEFIPCMTRYFLIK